MEAMSAIYFSKGHQPVSNFCYIGPNWVKARDARTPQPGEIVFNTMRYRSSETVQRSGYFQSSVIQLNSKMTALISTLKIMKL